MTSKLLPGLDKCAAVTGCDVCPSRRDCLPPAYPIGRRPVPVTVDNVCNAVQATRSADGKPRWAAAARWIETHYDVAVTRGMVQRRYLRAVLNGKVTTL